MNSRKIAKKRLNQRRDSGRISKHRVKKKKKIFSNSFREYLITNWIENEGDDERNDSSMDVNIFHKNCQIKATNEDEDSLHIENLHRLSTMKNILFLDLENFSSFFQHLTNHLPDQTFIFAFSSSNIQWKPPKNHSIYQKLIQSNHFQLMHPSGHRHDAADFALVLTVIFLVVSFRVI